jgi:hypothetical protein
LQQLAFRYFPDADFSIPASGSHLTATVFVEFKAPYQTEVLWHTGRGSIVKSVGKTAPQELPNGMSWLQLTGASHACTRHSRASTCLPVKSHRFPRK